MEAAESQFRLNVADKHGYTIREELEGKLERRLRPERREEIEEELAGRPFPPELLYLYNIFNSIRRRKGSNGFGPNPIDGQDIESYERRHQCRLAPWEQEAIEGLDDIYMQVQNETVRANSTKPP
jgi:hypothetical protein